MFYLIFLFCQYLRWVQYARNRVHVTCFVRLENEFIELNFHTYKSSSMNSVSILANRVHWTRFVLKETTILVGYVSTIAGTTQKSTSGTQKKLSSNFKHTVTLSHSQSLPLTLNFSFSLSVELSLTLTLSFRAYRFVAGTVTGCSRRRRCLSLPSVHLRLAQSFSLSGWRTTSQK